jgi:hypothetical protein
MQGMSIRFLTSPPNGCKFLEARLAMQDIEVMRMKELESGISAVEERRALLCHL